MITLRRSGDRGHFDHGWLDTRHTFSFGEYHDPSWMGFGTLRVLNEDRVKPGEGFPTHPHRDMEILSIVLSGALRHRDSLGTGSAIVPGEIQRMSAGRGITHSEFNDSRKESVHFLQIWIVPETRGIEPGYEQRAFGPDASRGKLLLVASRDGREGSVTIHQDASVYLSDIDAGETLEHPLAPGRSAWVHVVNGGVHLRGTALAGGDAAGVTGEPSIPLLAEKPSRLLLFDLG